MRVGTVKYVPTFERARPMGIQQRPSRLRKLRSGTISPMTLDEYQAGARTTALYPEHARIIYPALKLAGEAGEVTEKLGMLIRDEGYRVGQQLTEAQTNAMAKELGDVLWYVANLAADLGLSLEDVGELNLAKLASRKERGVLGGSGDDR